MIHKVQGMTRTSDVVSLKQIFEPGMAYVAISRVTSLSGLHMLDMDESKIHYMVTQKSLQPYRP